MKEDALKTLASCRAEDLEIGEYYFSGYDFPKRPKWNFEMSKEQLDANENRYFFVSCLAFNLSKNNVKLFAEIHNLSRKDALRRYEIIKLL